MPLVFKLNAEVTTEGKDIILAEFDSTKFQKLRVAVKLIEDGNGDKTQNWVAVRGVEDSIETYLDAITVETGYEARSVVIDAVPRRIRLKSNAAGKYRIFIWGM